MATAKYLLALATVILLAASVLAGTPPVPPPPYGGADIRDTSITTKKIKATGVTSGNVMQANGGDTAIWGSVPPANSGSNFNLYGYLYSWGPLIQIGQGAKLDTSFLSCAHATVKCNITIPTFGSCTDSSALHPSPVYIPGGWNGYKIWSTFSLNTGTCGENTFLRASNDGQNWYRPIVGTDTAPDPLSLTTDAAFTDAGVTPSYASDPSLLMGTDGKLWAVTRCVYSSSHTGGDEILFARSSTNGAVWSDNVKIFQTTQGTDTASNKALSPAIWAENGSYRMLTVATDTSSSVLKCYRILLYGAPKMDSGWAVIDTVREEGRTGTYTFFPAGSSTSSLTDDSLRYSGSGNFWSPWHIGVIDNGPDEKIVLLSCMPTKTSNGGSTRLFVGSTRDGGHTIKLMESAPILSPSTASLDSNAMYRSGGWIENEGGYRVVKILYSALSGSIWHCALTTLYIGAPLTNAQIVGHVNTNTVSDSALSPNNISWPGEWIDLSTVHVLQPKSANDSVVVTTPRFTTGASPFTDYLFNDSSFKTVSVTDTVLLSGMVPFNGYADSVAFTYYVSGVSGKIDSISLSVGMGVLAASSDTTFYGSGTDRSSGSPARAAYGFASKRRVYGGQKIYLALRNVLATQYGTVKVVAAGIHVARYETVDGL